MSIWSFEAGVDAFKIRPLSDVRASRKRGAALFAKLLTPARSTIHARRPHRVPIGDKGFTRVEIDCARALHEVQDCL